MNKIFIKILMLNCKWYKRWWIWTLIIAGFSFNIISSIIWGNGQGNLFTAISGWVSGIATIVLGGIAIWQNKKFHKEAEDIRNFEKSENQKNRTQQLLLTCPMITFDEIDSFDSDSGGIIYGESSNYLVLLNECKMPDKTNEAKIFMRLAFNCETHCSLKNISINKMTIYTNFDKKINYSGQYEFCKRFENLNEINISLKENNKYQIALHLLFADNKEVNGRSRNEKSKQLLVEQMLCTNQQKEKTIFFNFEYTAINIFNVGYRGEIKFYCKAKRDSDENILFFDYENKSNWITTQPELFNFKEKK